ncbi:ATP-binding cassette domain-containing protein [Enterococcus faecalis]|uniref:ATP-binding cassette domain-containing protein n=1 Tax=Enterococcus faecalis TaxID=1351 RepID=A0A8B3RTN1_ENTFL|nr:ATP-binding cassette domain-containing protein [Enterococcus faecalis]EGO8682378.1 ATP-binding cassette domain-containing protein [Enterococcus faecalis]EGO8720337.1 ATP-binding cassette domain-containing protein [Enterococcus faecalis]EGO8757559.1 ATP-binding cassette domain-containing protein [Enterococcus faecalis]EGO9019820.1 ATP-binding cassette domain-containing protein [Enterococcus faecalis]EGO9150352.1 ATP-binding cassette domain-containing protein [Enterococcus faecalis]
MSFELYEGDILVVIGGDGSGKSTLMKLIGRLLFSSEGKFKNFSSEECVFLIEESAFIRN